MRKFLLSGAVLGAIFSGLGVIRSTIKGPRDFRLIFTWLAWIATAGVAVGTVLEKSKKAETWQQEREKI